MLLPLQGVTNGCALTQGVVSLALGYALVGLSARLELNPKLYLIILLLAVFSFLQGVFCQFLIRNSSLLLIKRLTKSTLLEKSKYKQALTTDLCLIC